MFCLHTFSMSKTVLFQTIRFSKSTQYSSTWPIERTLSGATIPSQSGTGSDGNKGVIRIPQSSSYTGGSSSDFLVSYPGHSLGESYPFSVKQSAYSIAPTDRASHFFYSLSTLLKTVQNFPKTISYIIFFFAWWWPMVENINNKKLRRRIHVHWQQNLIYWKIMSMCVERRRGLLLIGDRSYGSLITPIK